MQVHATVNCGRGEAGEAGNTWLLRLHATGIYRTATVVGAVGGEALPISTGHFFLSAQLTSLATVFFSFAWEASQGRHCRTYTERDS